jgi:superfamily I DNA and/or RNA helicase
MDSITVRELTKSVSSYFLNYLETDFKKQQTPGRRLQLQREGGLRVGLSLSRYAPLNSAFWAALTSPASELDPIIVSRRAYTTTLTDRFRDAVVKSVRYIPEEVYALVRQQIVGCAESSRAESEYADTWVTEMFRSAAQEICERVIHPLLASLDPFLRRDAQALLEATYDLEGELTNILLQPLNDDFSTALYTMASAGKTEDLWDVLTRLFTRDHSQGILIDYFETFATADAYVDVKQLVSSMKSRENMELYLYLGVLQFRKNTFPLFYIPLSVEMEEETTKFRISLKPQVLVYKRAVDYILQETNARTEATSPISERILYATGDDTLESLLKIPTTQVLSALRLPPEFRVSSDQREMVDTANYSLESSLHLAVYDKSDESLLNDYEELLTAARGTGGPMLDLFESMIKAVVMEDPISVDKTVGDDWERLNISERLVHASPIPINEEQSKIIAALKQPNCRFVSVEGPPGTGKSHTISAIAFDAILSKKSVLLLSDKREALDVVEDKLEQTLASVRPSGLDFPNPILRLGKEGNNFRRLLQGSTVQQISDYNRAARSKEGAVKSELAAGVDGLKKGLHQTADALSGIPLGRVRDLHRLEAEIDAASPGASDDIRTFLSRTYDSKLTTVLAELGTAPELHLTSLLQDSPDADLRQIRRKSEIFEFTVKLCKEVNCSVLRRFHHLTLEDGPCLSVRIDQIETLRRPIIGYLFRSGALNQIAQQLNAEFSLKAPFQIPSETRQLREVAALLTNIEGRCRVDAQGRENTVLEIILSSDGGAGIGSLSPALREFSNLFQDRLTERLSYRHAVFCSAADYAKFLLMAMRYAGDFQALTTEFGKLPEMDFIGSRTRIEQLYSTQMASEIDSRFLTFVQEHRAEAKSLGAVIRARQKFPEDRFDLLRSAFPVIIASIREFAEYMPLMPELFDIVVIDEASQVSIAQAFPAILRAKKLVVLGDNKQFSNVKSSQASNELNQQSLSDIKRFFSQKVTRDAGRLQRLAMFDVKRSVLEFVDSCANYKTMLRKHFRGYLELISFSSQYFYNGTLQAVKIRGCPIEDVIEFVHVDAEPEDENVNSVEGDYILEQLYMLADQEKPLSVGVITPFRQQQIALQKLFSGDVRGAEFESKLRLKVMTFDSCQGEERGIIFYSLVASKHSDRLSWIFPVSLEQADADVQDKLRMQRLNVGFSRAQEKICFVVSKPIDEYRGSIGRVLNHYRGILTAKGIATASQTDKASPMERQVLEWLKATRLFQLHGQSIELIAQFPVGDYLKQLDPTYVHPSWKADFLLSVPTKSGRPVQIIIEYDGFEFHFNDRENVHAGNYDQYMSHSDVERQKVLESYGYKFLRLNRFNIGHDPVLTLSNRIEKLVNTADVQVRAVSLDAISSTVEKLQNKTAKECGKCATVKDLQAFFDRSLAGGKGGYGRICLVCKRAAQTENRYRATGPRGRFW